MLIGLAGKKGSGKSTAAAAVIDKGARSYSLATPLKLLIGQCYQLSHEQLFGELKEIVDERYGKTPRQLLQEVGTDVLRAYDPNIWVHCLPYLVKAAITTIIDDVRFPNEVKAIQAAGGVVIYIKRSSLESTDVHASENAITSADCGPYIVNDTTIQALRQDTLDMVKIYG